MVGAGRSGVARKVPVATMLVRDIQLLVTMNKDGEEISEGALYVKGNEIAWVGATASIPEEYRTANTVVSLPDRVVIPGANNDLDKHVHMHVHACMPHDACTCRSA